MESSYSFRQNILKITNIILPQIFWYSDKKWEIRAYGLAFTFWYIKQDFRLVICLFMCFTPSGKYLYTCRTKTSLPEMRSEGTLWKTDMLTRSRVINQDVFNLRLWCFYQEWLSRNLPRGYASSEIIISFPSKQSNVTS